MHHFSFIRLSFLHWGKIVLDIVLWHAPPSRAWPPFIEGSLTRNVIGSTIMSLHSIWVGTPVSLGSMTS